MVLSKRKIKFRTRKKTNPATSEVIAVALKNPEWKKIAQIVSAGSRNYSSKNLYEIEEACKEGDLIVIPGKVLSEGELTKKVKIAALGISTQAKVKLAKSKSEFILLSEEIKKNPSAKGVHLLI